MEIIPNWHPVFVHFTVALLSTSVGLYVVSAFINQDKLKNQCHTVARWNLWLGMAITVVTLLTGWYAYNTVAHDEPSHLAMTDHRNWALITAGVFFLLSVWSVFQHRKKKVVSHYLTVGLVIAFVLLASTAWRGGEVVYRYGLGVMSLPQAESEVDDGHLHSHETVNEKLNNDENARQITEKTIPHGGDGHSH